VQPDTLPEVPAAAEVALYRIGSEAIHNAVRHRGGQRCPVRIAVTADEVEMTIRANIVTDDLISVLISAEHALLRRGLRAPLSTVTVTVTVTEIEIEIEIVGEASDGETAAAMAAELAPTW
jgi:signal transduction histidine kinase